MDEFRFMELNDIFRFLPLIEKLGVSKQARSGDGFLTAYMKAKGKPTELPKEWVKKRMNFIKRHLGAVKAKNEKLLDKDGLPTRRALALIAWAYNPFFSR